MYQLTQDIHVYTAPIMRAAMRRKARAHAHTHTHTQAHRHGVSVFDGTSEKKKNSDKNSEMGEWGTHMRSSVRSTDGSTFWISATLRHPAPAVIMPVNHTNTRELDTSTKTWLRNKYSYILSRIVYINLK